MRWNTCAPAGQQNLAPICNSNVSESRLALSFTTDATVDSVVGWVMVLDLASDAPSLPSWWQVQPGGCRAGNLAAAMPNGTEGDCDASWASVGGALVQSVLYPRPGGDARQLRVVVAAAVPPDAAFTLPAGTSELGAVLSVHYLATVGTGACPGCAQPACLVFNSVEIQRHPGATGSGPSPCVTPDPVSGNQCAWASGTACSIVPVRTRTWGQIKALYR